MKITKLKRIALAGLVGSALAGSAVAHHNYTRPNVGDASRMLALYHFDNEPGTVGSEFSSPGFATPRGLRVSTPTAGGATLTTTTDVAYPVLGPNSVQFNGRQSLVTTESFAETIEDCTIEFWIKWRPEMTSSTLLVGANAGPKVMITRDNTNSLNDRFGIQTAHGDFRSAPDFGDWTEWESEPSTNGWWVVAMAIHSTGVDVEEDDHGHEDAVYKAGSYAIFFVNNHPVGLWGGDGAFLGKVDISGMALHDHSNLYVRCEEGAGVMVDDFIWWKEDLTRDGTELFDLFTNGRGEASGVDQWGLY